MKKKQAEARVELEKIDILVVPTAAYNYTVREIMAEEDEQDYLAMLSGKAMVTKNANLGRFTNFVNLLDMCGVSVFSGLMNFTDGKSLLFGRDWNLWNILSYFILINMI